MLRNKSIVYSGSNASIIDLARSMDSEPEIKSIFGSIGFHAYMSLEQLRTFEAIRDQKSHSLDLGHIYPNDQDLAAAILARTYEGIWCKDQYEEEEIDLFLTDRRCYLPDGTFNISHANSKVYHRLEVRYVLDFSQEVLGSEDLIMYYRNLSSEELYNPRKRRDSDPIQIFRTSYVFGHSLFNRPQIPIFEILNQCLSENICMLELERVRSLKNADRYIDFSEDDGDRPEGGAH